MSAGTAYNASELTMAVLRLDAAGRSRRQIADELGIGVDLVSGRLAKVTRTQIERLAIERQRKPRRCLGHGGMFVSDGPHHRVCDACKNRGAWQNPLLAGGGAGGLRGSRGCRGAP